MNQVLILGGQGRIGSSIAADLLRYTSARLTLTGRTVAGIHPLQQGSPARVRCFAVDLEDRVELLQAIAASDLVIHYAGPFRQRDARVLEACIEQRVNYVDVCDDRSYTQTALSYGPAAAAAGITAIVNTGIFPGISNSMARQGIEQVDEPEAIHIRYAVAGSGGAGVTVLRTTFMSLHQPFEAWIDGELRWVMPYTEPELVAFPAPLGQAQTYWFDMPELLTLAQTFSVKTVTAKFGSVPNFYNRLTRLMANGLLKQLMEQRQFAKILAQIIYRMTAVTDRFSGTGVAIQVEVSGLKNGDPASLRLSCTHPSTATATGMGAGGISQLILSNQIQKLGVWPVEQALSTQLFEQLMCSRGMKCSQRWF